jgi:hypothetical protein
MMDEIRDLAALRQSDWVEDLGANRDLVLEGIESLLTRLRKLKEDLVAGKLGAELDTLIARAGVVLNIAPVAGQTDLVLLSGQDLKTLEKASELMAKARISIGNLEKMEHAEPGTYRVSLKSTDDRNRAATLLRQAGLNVETLS